MAGSLIAAIVISRLLPMPPNAEPGSRPASARNTVPSSSRYTTANRSATALKGSGVTSIGTSSDTTTVLPKTTNGAR